MSSEFQLRSYEEIAIDSLNEIMDEVDRRLRIRTDALHEIIDISAGYFSVRTRKQRLEQIVKIATNALSSTSGQK